MFATLIAVLVGGLIAVANQATVDHLRLRAEIRKEKRTGLAIVKVHLFYYYSAQLFMRDSLSSGQWWPRERDSISWPSAQELPMIADILSVECWRLYSGALRRLSTCLALRDSHPAAPEPISTTDKQYLLGTFITVDEARRKIAPLVHLEASEIALDDVSLTSAEIAEALDRQVSQHVLIAPWRAHFVALNNNDRPSALPTESIA